MLSNELMLIFNLIFRKIFDHKTYTPLRSFEYLSTVRLTFDQSRFKLLRDFPAIFQEFLQSQRQFPTRSFKRYVSRLVPSNNETYYCRGSQIRWLYRRSFLQLSMYIYLYLKQTEIKRLCEFGKFSENYPELSLCSNVIPFYILGNWNFTDTVENLFDEKCGWINPC